MKRDESTTPATILVAARHPGTHELIRQGLADTPHRVRHQTSGFPGTIGNGMEPPPDLVVLEMEGDDRDVTNVMRAEAPVVMVTRRGSRDVAAALEAGAQDCIADPWQPSEVWARVGAALRRNQHQAHRERITLGTLHIDREGWKVTLAGRRVELRPTEFRMLWELAANAGRTMEQEELAQRVWQGQDIRLNNVRVQVKNLRRKLGEDARDQQQGLIQTVKGTGYRLAAPAEHAANGRTT